MNPKKQHYFTKSWYSNPDSNKVWFKSACKLISSSRPTKYEDSKAVNCKRCLDAITPRESK